jgi:hypothetical protein
MFELDGLETSHQPVNDGGQFIEWVSRELDDGQQRGE